ncbi:putative RNA methyltransferase [Agromyces sp. MMS24-K17]|uniref:putative RNA methyltransferase n=1 Tax=Agromyces sp. MMS24-K17 TaxID=3372850 RepID=UPI0037551E22
MTVDTTWLRCPNCFQDLESVDGRTVGCSTGHRFDESRQGYLTLLPPKAPRTIGDDRAMLDARTAFLDTGAYRPIADAVAQLASGAEPRNRAGGAPGITHRSASPRLADLGCGTGYYAAIVARRLGSTDVLLADRSPDAVRAARRSLRSEWDAWTREPTPAGRSESPGPERASERLTGVVLDLWRPLPLRDGVADVILDVFAPRNPSEFARVLAPGGRLIVVVPTVRHLGELRAEGAMLEIPDGKDEHVVGQLDTTGLELADRRRVDTAIEVDAVSRAHLIGMGPSAHHRDEDAAGAGGPESPESSITVSVDVLAFEHGR